MTDLTRDDLIKLLAPPKPEDMINTIHGPMKAKDLTRKVIEFENDHELTYAIEYWLEGESKPVHRSVHVQLKTGTEAKAAIASL